MKTQTANNIAELATVAVQKKLFFKIGVVEFTHVDLTDSYVVEVISDDVHTLTCYKADELKFSVLEYGQDRASVKVQTNDDTFYIRSGNISVPE